MVEIEKFVEKFPERIQKVIGEMGLEYSTEEDYIDYENVRQIIRELCRGMTSCLLSADAYVNLLKEFHGDV